jgi:hypothetical protein
MSATKSVHCDIEVPVIDKDARLKAIRLVKKLIAEELSVSEFENSWPRKTQDLGVRSIGFWMWTLFNDDEDGLIRTQGDPEIRKVARNAISFLSSEMDFEPRDHGLLNKIRTLFTGGVEWIGCELPWHSEWPNPSRRPRL